MCELIPIPYLVFLLTKKNAFRKSASTQQTGLRQGTNSKLHLKKTFIVKSLNSIL